jgi:hypothetical protein
VRFSGTVIAAFPPEWSARIDLRATGDGGEPGVPAGPDQGGKRTQTGELAGRNGQVLVCVSSLRSLETAKTCAGDLTSDAMWNLLKHISLSADGDMSNHPAHVQGLRLRSWDLSGGFLPSFHSPARDSSKSGSTT